MVCYLITMRVPVGLSENFKESFQKLIGDFLLEKNFISPDEAEFSSRYLNRSLVPHIKKLSDLFNRKSSKNTGLSPYWKKSANPENLRLAYFLYFMPPNLYRTASVWTELSRLGFRWNTQTPLHAIELGSGPASGVCGIAAGEAFAPAGLPSQATWALIESDQKMLNLGADWAKYYFDVIGHKNWEVKTFPRKLNLSDTHSLLPRQAPQFNLWILSYFLNEFDDVSIDSLLSTWKNHLAEDGIIIIIEPALKDQSRRLLELRKKILEKNKNQSSLRLKVLLPCLGEQNCGAFNDPKDWCHEEVLWWRPPYLKALDEMVKLDHKSLPFSYLVLTRSQKPIEEILPAFKNSTSKQRSRLVSPSHWEGKSLEFYVCSQDGKMKKRFKPEIYIKNEKPLDRGSIFCKDQIL